MYNRVTQVGRLTRDPVLRSTNNNIPVTNFNIAVNRNFVNGNGERDADFLPVVVWRKTAENCAKYLKKGSLVLVEGRLQSRTYEDNNGQRQFIIEIVGESVQFMDPAPNTDNNKTQNNNNFTETDYNPEHDNDWPF